MIPARWRLMTDGDRGEATPFHCGGDGVDTCRAPCSWIAERLDVRSRAIAIVAHRCPDHIPVRALHSLSPPTITEKTAREAVRAAVTAPPEEEPTADSGQPTVSSQESKPQTGDGPMAAESEDEG